jgi:transposase
MGKKTKLDITESSSELKKLLLKQKTIKGEKRIKCLLEIKSIRFDTRQDLADYLLVHIRTLERWVNDYRHGGLEQRVNDPHNPFLGYWDAQIWIKQEYDVDVKYQRIREYLNQHFKTKLKTPRKSHYKKDEEAEKAFLKTT